MDAFLDKVINLIRQPDNENWNPWLEWFFRFCLGAGSILFIVTSVFAFGGNLPS